MSLGLASTNDYETDSCNERPQHPWTVWRVALSVFLGNLMTAALAAIVLAFVKG